MEARLLRNARRYFVSAAALNTKQNELVNYASLPCRICFLKPPQPYKPASWPNPSCTHCRRFSSDHTVWRRGSYQARGAALRQSSSPASSPSPSTASASKADARDEKVAQKEPMADKAGKAAESGAAAAGQQESRWVVWGSSSPPVAQTHTGRRGFAWRRCGAHRLIHVIRRRPHITDCGCVQGELHQQHDQG